MNLAEQIVAEVAQRLQAGEQPGTITQKIESILAAESQNNPATVTRDDKFGFFDVALRVEARVSGAETAEIAEDLVRRWFALMPDYDSSDADRAAAEETFEALKIDDDDYISVTAVSVPDKVHVD
jgi:hypothetical protein